MPATILEVPLLLVLVFVLLLVVGRGSTILGFEDEEEKEDGEEMRS